MERNWLIVLVACLVCVVWVGWEWQRQGQATKAAVAKEGVKRVL